MAKQADYNWVLYVGIIVILIYGGTHDWFKSTTNIENKQSQTPQTPLPNQIIKEYLTYSASLDLSPNTICTGDSVTGTILTNINNGVCSIFYNTGTGYSLLSNVNLDGNGDYRQSQIINVVGTAQFVAVCCDSSNNCKLTNSETLTSQSCDSDNDGIPDETDPDDDNDGYSDEDEIAAGTDPKDPLDHPSQDTNKYMCCYAMGLKNCYSGGCPPSGVLLGTYDTLAQCQSNCKSSTTYTCGQGNDKQCQGTCPTNYECGEVEFQTYSTCVCLNPNTQTIHPDWKPGGTYHNPDLFDTECSDSDGGNVLTTKGTCTDAWNSYTDACIGTTYVDEKYCEGTICGGNSYACPSGTTCQNGACVTGNNQGCVDNDGGFEPFTASSVSYGGNTYSDVCHAYPTTSYAVDEYICEGGVPVKIEVQCKSSQDCSNGRCMTSPNVAMECYNKGYAHGGGCYASSGCARITQFDSLCSLMPGNVAYCCN